MLLSPTSHCILIPTDVNEFVLSLDSMVNTPSLVLVPSFNYVPGRAPNSSRRLRTNNSTPRFAMQLCSTFQLILLPLVEETPLSTSAAWDGTESCIWLWTGSVYLYGAVCRGWNVSCTMPEGVQCSIEVYFTTSKVGPAATTVMLPLPSRSRTSPPRALEMYGLCLLRLHVTALVTTNVCSSQDAVATFFATDTIDILSVWDESII